MLKTNIISSKNLLIVSLLGVSFSESSLHATNPVMDVDVVSKKRDASNELLREDETLKKFKNNLEEKNTLSKEDKYKFVTKNREQIKQYNTFAQKTKSEEKKAQAYQHASVLCDQILEIMDKSVEVSDIRNAAVTHYNLSFYFSDLNAKVLSFSRSAYLFNELITRTGDKSTIQDLRRASVAHYQVSRHTTDDNMLSVYYSRAVELYNEANEVEINSFWNF